jgi:tetratricopeptide (TPR) repeat protein
LATRVGHYLGRAITYTNNKWFKRALREYERITEIIPDSAFAYNAQADILILTGEDDKAIEICKQIIDLEPESPFAYNKLAGIYNRNGDNDEAAVQYRRVINIDPYNATAYLNLGIILESKDLIEESIKAYEKVIELVPSSPAAYNNLAWLYASKMQDKLDYALKLAEQARELAPDSAAVIDTYGWICYLSGMYDEALSELKTAVGGAPWNPTIRYHLGMAYYRKGLQRLALTEMERALDIGNKFPEAKEAKDLIEEISNIKGAEKKVNLVL